MSFTNKLFSLKGRGAVTFPAFQIKCKELSSPQKNFRSIHVGGTNGKGSTAMMIARGLQNAGYKVGLYTSPHIYDFRERIQINFEKAPLEKLEPLFEKSYDPNLSFFDVLTLMAFLYFSENKVDFAVIEVGLGGRFDATNVVNPILSIITSIGFDHTELLGETLEKIAYQKGGIIKEGVPVIVGPSAVAFFPQAIHIAPQKTFTQENLKIAEKALEVLDAPSPIGCNLPFRLQKKGGLILDSAHNPSAFLALKKALEYNYPNQCFDFALAFSQGKDWHECVRVIEPIANSIRMIRSNHPRLLKSYPGFDLIEPNEVKNCVVAGSFYVFDELQQIQSKELMEPFLN